MLEHPDKLLAKRILDGDEKAFDEFFNANAAPLYRFVHARLGGRDAEHVEDLTQATLLRAISRLETYRGESSLLTWMCSVSRGEISDFHRRRNREPQRTGLDEETEGGHHPDAELTRKDLAAEVHAVLDALPHPYGNVLEWKYIEGLSAREIADRLGLTTKAAESSLTRAREAFRSLFDRRARTGRA